jgi:hypothetical protein
MNPVLPVRSADLKHCTGGLVVRWVTTSEYLLLYVFVPLFSFRDTVVGATALLYRTEDKFSSFTNVDLEMNGRKAKHVK